MLSRNALQRRCSYWKFMILWVIDGKVNVKFIISMSFWISLILAVFSVTLAAAPTPRWIRLELLRLLQ